MKKALLLILSAILIIAAIVPVSAERRYTTPEVDETPIPLPDDFDIVDSLTDDDWAKINPYERGQYENLLAHNERGVAFVYGNGGFYPIVPGEFMVTIKHSHSGLNKEWHAEDFPGIAVAEIEYVTTLKDKDPSEYPMLNYSAFCQILLIRIEDKSAAALKEAMIAASKLDFIQAVDTNGYVFLAVSPYNPGDVNDDGKLNAKDVTDLMKLLVRGTSANEFPAADFNSDGNVNAKDVTDLMKFIIEYT